MNFKVETVTYSRWSLINAGLLQFVQINTRSLKNTDLELTLGHDVIADEFRTKLEPASEPKTHCICQQEAGMDPCLLKVKARIRCDYGKT